MSEAFCSWCGGAAGEGRHEACQRRRVLDPPRYCSRCARRMVVQVTPAGWTARCSAHGTTSSAMSDAPTA
ncbi:hypothetical protein LX15_000675 [Streptoalloteichus tenebrarius]|uniref:Biotin synthase auxiliary protein n=1 Tax=Streptoalloteichus tenebrarius (strain ATCC 17920 / DSM 40477 / JCM 4838 / CBS 697.72 / NBRC 16177 / NCIMB 11028 / NRRL B-12390 / A12253. 1 / ISP 5477) TaxID=1933 RepID=A0ABT1HNA5_STRSD|nr:hypothetical protein [Streptoalloteichus tenebrarius]MCP2256992.1 hypothetical protein [Streptoalloteichus tenebrarius]